MDKRASLEVIAPTVEEAIAKGLNELGLQEDSVEIEVLDAGSRGLFGLGARQARVRMTIKAGSGKYAAPEAVEPSPERVSPAVSAPRQSTAAPEPPAAAPARPARTEPAATPTTPPPAPRPMEPQAASPAQAYTTPPAAPEAKPAVELDESQEEAVRVARETVAELLDKMKVQSESVTAHYGEPDEPHSKAPLYVDVRGNDLSILIGPRAETLNALQYIANLIVSKELGHSVPLIVDVEGYRARREQSIRQLARRMAEQAVKTGHRQVLEPMPASERRLIHIELRNHPNVSTESVGEEPRRKVTIFPK